ncbi:MAG TPA: TrkA family potassium uptake protein [Solirubrobacteraceae bacterium]
MATEGPERPGRPAADVRRSEPGGLKLPTPGLSTRTEMLEFAARMGRLGMAIAGLLLFGTVGFAVTEHVSVWYAFNWALDTVATSGAYPAPRQVGGEIMKDLLTVFGVGTLFYALVTVTEFFVAGHLGELLGARRAQRMIDSFTDHYIICGFGRVGRQVARDLSAAEARFVVIDDNAENRERAHSIGVRFIEGDAADDVVLERAGIARARAIIAAADSDASNIFITLTARELRTDIVIVARASVEDSEKKLKRAGADRVISPYKASGTEMARLALHPQVAGIFDVDSDYRMEEIVVSAGCEGESKTVGDIRGGSLIVGLRRDGGGFEPQPPAETVLRAGDVLMALGTPRTLDRLEALFLPVKDRQSQTT